VNWQCDHLKKWFDVISRTITGPLKRMTLSAHVLDYLRVDLVDQFQPYSTSGLLGGLERSFLRTKVGIQMLKKGQSTSMNEEDKRTKYQAKRSKGAERIEPPIVMPKERGNLDAVVSLRFSSYELSLLRKECLNREIGLSALIREFVINGLEKQARELTDAVHDSEGVQKNFIPVRHFLSSAQVTHTVAAKSTLQELSPR